jgi:hypothetical protein
MQNKIAKYFVFLFSLYVLYLSISVVLNGEVSLKYNAMSMDDINYIIHYALIVIVYEITVLVAFLLHFFSKKK